MAAYLVGAIDIHVAAGYDQYRIGAMRAVEQFGGEVLSADDTPDMLEGTVPAGHLLVESLRRWSA